MATAAALKDEGNKAYASKKYGRAVELYTKAIALEPENHVLFSNRCAAYVDLGKPAEAVADAQQVVKLAPTWVKGYARLASALQCAGKHAEAAKAAAAGLQLEPANADLVKLREKLASVALEEQLDRAYAKPTLPEVLREAQQSVDLAAIVARLAAEAEAAGAAGAGSTSAAHLLSTLAAAHPRVAVRAGAGGRGRALVAAVDIGAGEEVMTETAVATYCHFGDVMGAAIPRLLEVNPAFAAAGGDVYAVLVQLEPFASYLGLEGACLSKETLAAAAAKAAGRSRSKADLCMRVARQNTIGGCFDDAKNDEESRLSLIAPVTAMCNHDCLPNARYTVSWNAAASAPSVRLFALRPIPAGEEVTISYIDIAGPRAERQAHLRAQYDFTCACSRCSAPWDDTVVFKCPACADGRVFGNATACADCGAALADPSLAALPAPAAAAAGAAAGASAEAGPAAGAAAEGGAWWQARQKYLADALPGEPGERGAARPPRIGVSDLVLKDGRADTVVHRTDPGRMGAIYGGLGGLWGQKPADMAAAWDALLPLFAASPLWAPQTPQLHILGGHVNVTAGRPEAALACYREALARYTSQFGPPAAHPYTALVAEMLAKPPRNRQEVERYEVRRVGEGNWGAQGLPKRALQKWQLPIQVSDPAGGARGGAGGAGDTAAVAALDQRRVVEELQRLTAEVLSTNVHGIPLVALRAAAAAQAAAAAAKAGVGGAGKAEAAAGAAPAATEGSAPAGK